MLLPVVGGLADPPAPVTPEVATIDLGSVDDPAANVAVVAPEDAPAPKAEGEAADSDSSASGAPPSDSGTTTDAPADPSTTESSPGESSSPSSEAPGSTSETPDPNNTSGGATPSAPDDPDSQILVLDKTETAGYSMAGVSWDGEAPVGSIAIQIRTKDAESGEWSDWTELSVNRDVAESGTEQRQGTDPFWFGTSDGIELAITVGPEAAVSNVSATLIDPQEVSADANPTAGSPTSAAGAAGEMPSVYSRAQWGADESLRTWDPQYMPTIKAATIHHTADSNNYGAADVPRIMRSIYYYQAVTLGWGDIGYNVVVDKFGRAWEGRYGGLETAVVGAHAGGFNRYTFGVSMLGNYDVTGVPNATQEMVSQLIAWKFNLFGVDAPAGFTQLTQVGGAGTTAKFQDGQTVTLPKIFGHRDVGNTACPGSYGYSILQPVRNRVAAIMATLPPPNKSPVGTIEAGTSSGFGKATIAGWAYDPDEPSTAIPVALYRDGVGISWYPTSVSRPDVNAAYQISGSHGFQIDLASEPRGNHEYCVIAIDTKQTRNQVIGCKTVNVQGGTPPFATVDRTQLKSQTVSITGWAFDPDSPSSSGHVAVYRNGTGISWYETAVSRPDVNSVFGISGTHGFSITLSNQPLGLNSYCVYAIDNEQYTGSPTVGCYNINVQSRQPVTGIDKIAASGSTVRFDGWSYDPDAPSTSTYVALYRDGQFLNWYPTSVLRPDVNAAFGLSGNHGFGINLTGQPSGPHTYCLFAIDESGRETNPLVRCANISVN